MKIQDITDGLKGLGFTDGWAVGGDPAQIILWENAVPQPSESEILAAAPLGAYQRDYLAVTVARQNGYQSTSDPVFMQYQRGEATEQEWLDAVQAVKDANPYPEAV